MLALHRAEKLDILRLGTDYALDTDSVVAGARISVGEEEIWFAALVDATGQSPLAVRDLLFPGLLAQGLVEPAQTLVSSEEADLANARYKATGGINLDAFFRPVVTAPVCTNLYCAAIPFLLHKMPFVQGITSAKEIGDIVSRAITGHASETRTSLILATA